MVVDMPEYTYRQLGKYFDEREALPGSASEGVPYLLFGDDVLVEKAFNQLLDGLMPAERRSFGYEPLEAAAATATDVVERVNTFSLSPGLKVVAWLNAALFRSSVDRKQLIESARRAYGDRQTDKAAGIFLRFLSSVGLSLEDIGGTERASGSLPGLSGGPEDDWVDDLIDHCLQNDLRPDIAEDQADVIKRALERGLPPGHCLVITTEAVDRRQGLFKVIRDRGVVVDCSVPAGNRRADRQAQQQVLAETMEAVMGSHGKRMDRSAFDALCEKTGFDLRTFASNLEILASFVGDRRQVTAADVADVLLRTKRDPIYELTGAVSDRNLGNALFFLDSLLAGDAHPLQILAALANQVRRLLLAKDFAESAHGSAWFEGCTYNQFKTGVVPAMTAYDQQLQQEMERWQPELNPEAVPVEGRSGRRKKGNPKPAGDLLLARNPRNAYPLYLLMRKIAHFGKDELLRAVAEMPDSDRLLKSSARNPKVVLERLIMRLCGVDSDRP